ncbi:CBS domain-containing protein [Nostoc sp. PCC 9305]|uniref:CBS domain-containing protein n=1 Tax=Nostoc sp. PCC 9305 TaxID=296636 RepID=UPI0039C6032E
MVPEKLQEIARQVYEDNSQAQETVRTLLTWFGAKRRRFVVDTIRKALTEVNLATEPDFTNVYIDAEVRFVPAQKPNEAEAKAITEDAISATYLPDATAEVTTAEFVYGAIEDPTFRIGQLASANSTPIVVNPNLPLLEATTLMMMRDFSQLPVMQSEREVKGVISWESIGRRISLKRPCERVRDCMETTVPEVTAESSLFSAIDLIVKHGYVLVRQQDQKISGIVTTSDLSLQFRQLTEPFLLVGEIENYVRRLIDGKFTTEQLASVRDPKDERVINSVVDLTFGEYLRLLEKPEHWNNLNISIDRATFIKHLDIIRELRNDVMHFDPDPFAEEDIQMLRLFINFMRILDPKKV